MAQLPAICDRCGTAFNSGIAADNVLNLRIEHCRAGPCPACGAIGHIPDGLYDVVGSVITILQAPGRTVAELRRLKEILEDATKRREDPQATAKRVERELPALTAVAEEFRRAPVGTSAALGTLLLTAILVVQASRDSAPQDRTTVVEQTIKNYVTTLPNAQRSRNPKATPPPAAGPGVTGPKVRVPVHVAPRPGRNEPCPCGSGKKYKKCCGAPSNP